MILSSSRSGIWALLTATGLALTLTGSAAAQTAPDAPASAADATLQLAPTVSAATPAAADERLAAKLVEASPGSRHLAPHDTFYLLSYVAVRTDKGVEGFDPGQEVHLVEVHRDTQTLVVSDGHASVEVPPSKLTNDLDIAVLVRRQDEASQTQLAAHLQTEREAYARYERETAEATARDLAQRQQARQAEAASEQAQEQAPVAQTAAPATTVDSTLSGDAAGYYGVGGYGYGDPYSYFSSPVIVRSGGLAAPRIPAAASAPAAVPTTVIAPAGHAGGGRHK